MSSDDNQRRFYIDGAWIEPLEPTPHDVIDPATEAVTATILLGGEKDVDAAVAAARRAFPAFSQTSREERLALLGKIIEGYKARMSDLAAAVTREMGAPVKLASRAQAPSGLGHFMTVRKVLEGFAFEERIGGTLVRREAAGVCAFITPWNWPLNQIACKVAPALAAGCTMVLKPSEEAPLSAVILAEILHEAGVPAGVFNLVHGDGPTVGAALSRHPEVDMVSFTGSTGAGVKVAQAAAPTVKRVHQELGGKSAHIVLDDADLERAVAGAVRSLSTNTGQSCNAGTRLLVPRAKQEAAKAAAKAAAEKIRVGDPQAETTHMGPVAGRAQFERVQRYIEKGTEEGATLVAGGPGRPEGLERGFFVRPTVFADVTNDMAIAREEIFGPVLAILPYDDEAQAIAIANDSPYGLSGYVSAGSLERAQAVARQLRTGQVHLNGAGVDQKAPFGGYKQSGNGREWGRFGFEAFLETQAIMGLG